MSTAVPASGPASDDASSAAARPSSPGPDPDDINPDHDSGDLPATGGDAAQPARPTSPGPNPDDLDQ